MNIEHTAYYIIQIASARRRCSRRAAVALCCRRPGARRGGVQLKSAARPGARRIKARCRRPAVKHGAAGGVQAKKERLQKKRLRRRQKQKEHSNYNVFRPH